MTAEVLQMESSAAFSEIKLAWWNTSLSPNGKSREMPSDFGVVEFVLNYLLNEINVDFCALGEICQNDIQQIKEFIKYSDFEVFDGLTPVGRSTFSTCFVVRRNKLNFRFTGTEVIAIENSKYKLAQKVYLATIDQDSYFHIYVSHWPSRLHVPAKDSIRATLGDRLRQNVDSILNSNEKSNVVLMGDFNDEPFDSSVSEHLRATRDRDLVSKTKPSLLYNPFWRHLCHPISVSSPLDSRSKPESWGTYFHKNGTLFRWRTFDQMMFSSSFLGNGNWYLNDTKTHVVDLENYTNLVIAKKSSFDHLPIVATLERKTHD